MSAGTPTSLFILYSGLNGNTLSSIFLIYTRTSIVSTFFVCAATFVTCSIYGWTTKRDLISFGGFLVMELIGIIIASLVNMFVHSTVAWECSLHTFDILYAFTHDQTLCLVYEDFYLAIGFIFYEFINICGKMIINFLTK